MRISGAVITLNEEKNISKCLNNMRPHVREIVVVDGGSTDRTAEIAKECGARVYIIPFADDFVKQRNTTLSYCRYNWVLMLDADEVASNALYSVMPILIKRGTKHDIDSFGIPRVNFIDNQRTEAFPDYQYRLINKKFCFYVNCEGSKIHETTFGYRYRAELASNLVLIHDKTLERHQERNAYYEKLQGSL